MNSVDLLSRRRAKPISLTALIDVVFILLMFFMLTSSFSRWNSIPLDLAGAGGSDHGNEAQYLLLHSDSSASYLRGGQREDAPITALLPQIDPEQSITLLPAPEISLQQIVLALSALEAAGIEVLLGRSHSAAEAD